MQDDVAQRAFETLSGAEGDAQDLSSHAQEAEAPNALRHIASLTMTKVADGLIDPKLMLSWLLMQPVLELGACNKFCPLKTNPWTERCGWGGCGDCIECTALRVLTPTSGECALRWSS